MPIAKQMFLLESLIKQVGQMNRCHSYLFCAGSILSLLYASKFAGRI